MYSVQIRRVVALLAIYIGHTHANAIHKAFAACLSPTVSNGTTIFTWEERPEKETANEMHPRHGFFQSLLRRWNPATSNDEMMAATVDFSDMSTLPTPHPLRTNLWEIHCRWRGQTYRRHRCRYSTLVFDFDPSGYVRVAARDDDPNDNSVEDDTWRTLGTWSLEPPGVKCRIPILSWLGASTTTLETSDRIDSADVSEEMNVLTMDFHVNPFGTHPKFTRGVLYGNRGRWSFRPVVATFTGRGIGDDTADLSYRQRNVPTAPQPGT